MANHFNPQVYTFLPKINPETQRKLEHLAHLYPEINDKVNLISRKDIDNLHIRHIAHSLSLSYIHDFATNKTVLDLGTGGGFPGLPLALMYPETHFILVDSITKKINALREIIEHLGIKNITTYAARAETLPLKAEVIVTRAVGSCKYLCTLAQNLLSTKTKQDGLLCLKGGNLKQELEDAGQDYKLYDIIDYIPDDFFKEKRIIHFHSFK